MKIVLLFALVMIGYTLNHKSWEKSGVREEYKLEPIVYKLTLCDSIPINTLEYPEKCFGSLELTKSQQRELDKYGCYCPLF